MSTPNTLFFLALLSAFWGVVSGVQMVGWLQRRGVKINFVFIKLYMFRYVHQYHVMSREEFGQVGPLFYHYLIAMNLALVLVVAGMAAR